MNIAIVGYGKQGVSALHYWQNGNNITICDNDTSLDIPPGVSSHLGPSHLQDLDKFDLVVRSPIVHPRAMLDASPNLQLANITSNTNEFLRICPTKKVIGVTGTKGKGTTSSLIHLMLKESGHTVHLGGNIGIPPLDLLDQDIKPDDWVVLELANFQLIDVQYSPAIAVCLMVVPEHLDWHKDLDEYILAKQQLFRWQTSDGVAIYYPDNYWSTKIATSSAARHLPYCQKPGAVVEDGQIYIDDISICDTSSIKLLGTHNLQNICAAVTAAWQITQDHEAIKRVLMSFAGLEHRLSFIEEVTGVRFYDDSFGTTPETAIVAIAAFKEPKVLILGGSDKGATYDELARAIKASATRHVLLIGEQATRLRQALEDVQFHDYTVAGSTMQEIVKLAYSVAHPGDIVLLSPACASFDMFKNYQDRAEHYITAVQALAAVER